ncbi:hypothetical protein [Priestia megaterium]|uniref:hypothetical protein n=1 Tax=Priestia megaterium TaxID=1404 RepID=UPI003CF798A1
MIIINILLVIINMVMRTIVVVAGITKVIAIIITMILTVDVVIPNIRIIYVSNVNKKYLFKQREQVFFIYMQNNFKLFLIALRQFFV